MGRGSDLKAMKANLPLVSVLMAVFDGERYLKLSIESILHQSYGEFEFLIVDDGSTDSTAEIIRSFDDPRIRLIKNHANLGLTRSLNLGLSKARGNLIARQDSDDVSMPDRLSNQVKALKSHPDCVLVSSWCDLIDEDGRRFGCVKPPTGNSDLLSRFSKADSPFPHGSVMFDKRAVLSIGGYDERFWFAQDFDLWLRLLGNGEREATVVPEADYKLRKIPPENGFKALCQRRYAAFAWEQHLTGERLEFADVGEWARRNFPQEIADVESCRREHWLSLSLCALKYGCSKEARVYAKRVARAGGLLGQLRALWRIALSFLPRGTAGVTQKWTARLLKGEPGFGKLGTGRCATRSDDLSPRP